MTSPPPPTDDDVEAVVRRLHEKGACSFIWADSRDRPCAGVKCRASETIRAAVQAGLAARSAEVDRLERKAKLQAGIIEDYQSERVELVADLQAEVERLRARVAELENGLRRHGRHGHETRRHALGDIYTVTCPEAGRCFCGLSRLLAKEGE